MTGAVAKRYARALFSLAVEEGRFDAAGEELARAAEAFRNDELAALARSAAVDPRTKREVVAQLAARLGIAPLVGRFLGLIAEKNRLAELAAIEEQYRRLVDRRLGRVRARIRSATALPAEGEREIREVFEKKTGKKVLAEVSVAPELIGGVAVEIEGRVYDGTLRTQLEAMKAALSG
ncbi:MAG: ATP synthase F1 subunit delta [Candidatus Binatia bacterium]